MAKSSSFQIDVFLALEEIALSAIAHVGMANYSHRETEATKWVQRARELAAGGASGYVIRHESCTQDEQKEPQA